MHSVYYDLTIEECEGYGYNYYSPNHPSNPYWNSNCMADCNGIANGGAMVDDCGDCQSGYCYDYVTHEVSFGACDGATQMWVEPNSPSNPYWNQSCTDDCGVNCALGGPPLRPLNIYSKPHTVFFNTSFDCRHMKNIIYFYTRGGVFS